MALGLACRFAQLEYLLAALAASAHDGPKWSLTQKRLLDEGTCHHGLSIPRFICCEIMPNGVTMPRLCLSVRSYLFCSSECTLARCAIALTARLILCAPQRLNRHSESLIESAEPHGRVP